MCCWRSRRGLDIERVETSGLLQRVEALVAHPHQKRAVGIEQPVEPVDQHADRQQIEQRLVAPGFRPARAPRQVPASRFVGSVVRVFQGVDGRSSTVSVATGIATAAPFFVVEPRRQLPGGVR